MRARTAVLAGLTVTLVAASAPAAIAAKKPVPKVCNLLVDPAGDGDWNTVPAVESSNIDIVSGDIATGPKELVAVLRMGQLNFAGDNWSNLGYQWVFGASAGGARYTFEYRRGNTGQFRSDVSIANEGVPHTVKIEKNAIVWRVPRKGVAPLIRPNLVWSGFSANTQVLSSTADDAIAPESKKYKDRAPSCVSAG